MTTKSLVMVFQTSGGGRMRITLADPRDDLTAADIQGVMNTVITKNVFESTAGTPTEIISAQVVSRDTTELLGA
jgi:hypothetical protein